MPAMHLDRMKVNVDIRKVFQRDLKLCAPYREHAE
jgi:hypothetical protein